jgi:hypothetical protein
MHYVAEVGQKTKGFPGVGSQVPGSRFQFSGRTERARLLGPDPTLDTWHLTPDAAKLTS